MMKLLASHGPRPQASGAARIRCFCTRTQQQIFDTKVEDFKAQLPASIAQKLERIAASACLSNGDRVLDAGTGTGNLIPYIQEQGPKDILAVDVSPNMLAEVTSRFGHNPVLGNTAAVRTWLGPIEELPPHQGRADTIFMNAVFGNLSDPPAALWKACNLLNPGGRIVISHPEGREWHTKLHKAQPDMVPHLLPDKAQLEEMVHALPLQLQSFDDEPEFYCAVLSVPPDFSFPGAPLHLQAKVVEGFQRGSKQMGVPTANMLPTDVEETLASHPKGVYFGWAQVQRAGDDAVLKAVMNYGERPTIKDGSNNTVEVHILGGNYAEDFYGEQLKMTVLGFIRPEIKFNGLDELVNRIFQDIGIAKRQLDSEEAQQFQSHSFFNQRGL
eukprot:jgi/Ulvmu1/1286/UM011_0010.1